MRPAAPQSRPVALTVAGSDSGGGAGIQADLRAMAGCGAFPTSVVTSVTAQHTRGVEGSFTLPAAEVDAQLDAVLGDFDVGAAKTGLLATREVVETVTDRLTDAPFPLVVDPVMVATSGDRLLDPDAERAYEPLLEAATVVTPNYDEAAVLTGVDVTDAASARDAAHALQQRGADAVLVTGGHGAGDQVVDVFVSDSGVRSFERPRVDTRATHGSGCTLSAAIAAELAGGATIETAVARAGSLVHRAVAQPNDVGEGPGAVQSLVDLRDAAAREPTTEAVYDLVDALVARDIQSLVPEVGLQVVGATPSASTPTDCAAVEGRLIRTQSGVVRPRGVRFGASSHVARALIAAREFDPELRFAANARRVGVEDRLASLDGPVGSFDRAEEPADADTMDWGVRRAFETADGQPVAVTDAGAVGKEPMVRVFARDAPTLRERLFVLAGV
ncbi:bifunctional hydroxymethylpyrimidine kinase/phosphomethylpyrimidine kinase [Halorarius litoreus]|uniref:bifunctional hydroxymethylpyrimidine kinase/phosphomethylpyrimidine kinase n=1 Tax=Halorarius litoreus TaxID=2962676 RepID=UPI0020CE11AE|nr:bifunctional hydroxymethylpyrimidine kinase/phosphomethylpyrimidine kinase [Halorarius litoreus]